MIYDFDKILDDWAKNVIARIQSNLDSTRTTASGKTKESLEYEVSNGELTIYGRQYFRSVEEGRPGGGIPRNFTQILMDWASAKGILSNFGDTEAKQRSAMYMVGQFIRKNGTRLYLQGGRDDIFTSVINEELPALGDQLAYEVQRTIVKNL